MKNKDIEIKMIHLREEIDKLVNKCNESYEFDETKRIEKFRLEISKKTREYRIYAQRSCFEDCLSTETPLFSAAKKLTFTTIDVKQCERKKKRHTRLFDPPSIEVVEQQEFINIQKFDEYVNGQLGINSTWKGLINKLNILLIAYKAIEIGSTPTKIANSNAMKEIEANISRNETPFSKTKILNLLKDIIHSMIGVEFSPASHDVNYLFNAYSRKTEIGLKRIYSNNDDLYYIILEICHRIITNKKYILMLICESESNLTNI